MICTLDNEMKVSAPSGMTELVRGNDHCLVAQLEPLVRRQNVALDLKAVDRIDAAGIAALIAIYGSAHEAGHEFRLCNVPTRVSQILALVGLEGILLAHAQAGAMSTVGAERTAA